MFGFRRSEDADVAVPYHDDEDDEHDTSDTLYYREHQSLLSSNPQDDDTILGLPASPPHSHGHHTTNNHNHHNHTDGKTRRWNGNTTTLRRSRSVSPEPTPPSHQAQAPRAFAHTHSDSFGGTSTLGTTLLRTTAANAESSSSGHHKLGKHSSHKHHHLDNHDTVNDHTDNSGTNTSSTGRAYCKDHYYAPHASRIQCLAVALVWCTVTFMAGAVVWYSYEFYNHGTDPHLIAWFSAGAFVLLGFPVSMWGILAHLTNYNHPATQVYIVRILWMVPLYSIQSWLAMRFHKQAVFIETARDCYESYVLYSFLQFLIQVLGGEEALVLMLKDKSVTVGHHMWGLQWCVKPWLMGQPVRRHSRYDDTTGMGGMSGMGMAGSSGGLGSDVGLSGGPSPNQGVVERVAAAMTPPQPPSLAHHGAMPNVSPTFRSRAMPSRVHWKSPFFIQCKFGVLQYVLLKFLCAVATLVMEYQGWYHEGSFHYTSGYLYICILTNLSQCWALYCLIFFYYATKTELSPIRPVGKFLSVKALVFFTWWQSVFVAVLSTQGMIPNYNAGQKNWTPEDVAKSIQDYLICIEMFIAAVVHTFVFPHSEYSVAAVRARANAIHLRSGRNVRRLGRHRKAPEVELVSLADSAGTWDDDPEDAALHQSSNGSNSNNFGLFSALLDSAIPRDLRDNTVNIMRGEYHVEKKTLLHHAATSDQYDLFSQQRKLLTRHKKKQKGEKGSATS